MSIFHAGGHEWELDLNLTSLERIESSMKMTLDEILGKLSSYTTMTTFAFWMVHPKAQERGVKRADFFEMVGGGETLGDLEAAVWETLLDFFPPKVSAHLRALKEQEERRRMELVQDSFAMN